MDKQKPLTYWQYATRGVGIAALSAVLGVATLFFFYWTYNEPANLTYDAIAALCIFGTATLGVFVGNYFAWKKYVRNE